MRTPDKEFFKRRFRPAVMKGLPTCLYCRIIIASCSIHGIEEGADLSTVTTGYYNPKEDIAMSFSKPESIDCVISVLKAIKQATFGKNNLVNNYLSD